MSFMLTADQIRERTKDVTRRLGWKFLKPGDELWAVDRCMGLKKGQKPTRLGAIRVVRVRRVPLHRIRNPDVLREGFPGMHWHQFVALFCKHMKCLPATVVTRIEFEYLSETQGYFEVIREQGRQMRKRN